MLLFSKRGNTMVGYAQGGRCMWVCGMRCRIRGVSTVKGWGGGEGKSCENDQMFPVAHCRVIGRGLQNSKSWRGGVWRDVDDGK